MPRIIDLEAADCELPPDLEQRLLTPALVVHLDRVRANARHVIERCGGDPERWRPHVKTTKLPVVFAELARLGVRNFKCATTRELAWLLGTLREEGVAAPDVLLAYPVLGPAVDRVVDLAREHADARVSILVEDPAAIPPAPVGVFVDVNSGMNRTGIPLADVDAIRAAARAAGDRFLGIHFYDGHQHDPNLAARRAAAHAGYARLLDLAEQLADAGTPPRELITSGTPSFLDALAFRPFAELAGMHHRVSPGTVVFHDLRSAAENPALDLVPAALVATRVISHPTDDIVTCDAGSKSIAAEAGDPCAGVVGHPNLEAQRPNEEHLPLRVRAGARPPRGTVLHLVPRHVCPTTNLHEQAVLLDEGRFLGFAPIRARAHDLIAHPRDGDQPPFRSA